MERAEPHCPLWITGVYSPPKGPLGDCCMNASVLAFGLSSLALGACVQQPASPKTMPGPVMSVADAMAAAVNNRKDELMRELAPCESGGSGSSDERIYGGRGA